MNGPRSTFPRAVRLSGGRGRRIPGLMPAVVRPLKRMQRSADRWSIDNPFPLPPPSSAIEPLVPSTECELFSNAPAKRYLLEGVDSSWYCRGDHVSTKACIAVGAGLVFASAAASAQGWRHPGFGKAAVIVGSEIFISSTPGGRWEPRGGK